MTAFESISRMMVSAQVGSAGRDRFPGCFGEKKSRLHDLRGRVKENRKYLSKLDSSRFSALDNEQIHENVR
jgi:hypothetical protein